MSVQAEQYLKPEYREGFAASRMWDAAYSKAYRSLRQDKLLYACTYKLSQANDMPRLSCCLHAASLAGQPDFLCSVRHVMQLDAGVVKL